MGLGLRGGPGRTRSWVVVKTFLWGLVSGVLFVGVVAAVWNDYRKVSALQDTGRDGTLLVLRETGGLREDGTSSNDADAQIAGRRLRVSDRVRLERGETRRVIYEEEALAGFDPRTMRSFGDFVYGERAESRWALFHRRIGTKGLVSASILGAAFLISCGWCFASVIGRLNARDRVAVKARGPLDGGGGRN